MQPLFVLASASPRRRELLELLELPFTVITPNNLPGARAVDETPHSGESPADLVRRLSRTKAQAVAVQLPSQLLSSDVWAQRQVIVVAADTIVVLGNKILGKPATPTEAASMLRALRDNRYHHVYSGVTAGVAHHSVDAPLPRPVTRVHKSEVWMRPYTDEEIEAYVASGDPLDKAGAYAIQHPGFAPVERLNGCFASVMGLPLRELASALWEINISPPDIASRCSKYFGLACCAQSGKNNVHG